jgi:hypothetical protein
MRENDSCGIVIYMGHVHGPEKVNDTCMKTMYAETMDRDFTIYITYRNKPCHSKQSSKLQEAFRHGKRCNNIKELIF